MTPFRRPGHRTGGVAVLLMIGLLRAGVFAEQRTRTAAAGQAADLWDTLTSLPVGSRVGLVLPDGSEIEGRLVEARADAVMLEDNKIRKGRIARPEGSRLEDRMTFPRSEVSRVSDVKPVERYQAGGTPDADAVRRVVAGIGPDRNVKLATTGGRRFHGRIHAIGQAGVSSAQGGTVSAEIPYGTIDHIEATKPIWPKVALIAGAAFGVFVLIGVMLTGGE